MKTFKKLLLFFLVITTVLLTNSIQINAYAKVILTESARNITNIGVSFANINDSYMSLVKQNLESIQNKNESAVRFTFFDAKDNQAIQDEEINSMFNSNFDLTLINLVNLNEDTITNVIEKAESKNVPVILFNTEPQTIPAAFKKYNRAIFITTDTKQSGILEGKIIVDKWNTNKNTIDKNGDNTLQYIMLQGHPNAKSVSDRTKFSISTIENAGIKTQLLESKVADWDRELGRSTIESLFLKYDGRIEAIISNNDAMALGAIDALQKYGYNKDDKSKHITVVGIDGLPETKDLVDKGIMSGTVIQDPEELAQALYTVGMNLISNLSPTENTKYTLDKTGYMILLPYYEYVRKS
jgi:methyl-galactoside transport system substrate-binding protein